MSRPPGRTGARTSERWVGAAFGLFLVGMAVAIVLLAADANPLGASAAALLIGGLGVDALVAAIRDRRSILSRIGPLP